MGGDVPRSSTLPPDRKRISRPYEPVLDSEQSGLVAAGVDIIEIARIERTLADFGDRFLRRVFTERERAQYGSRPHELAARFAARGGRVPGAAEAPAHVEEEAR